MNFINSYINKQCHLLYHIFVDLFGFLYYIIMKTYKDIYNTFLKKLFILKILKNSNFEYVAVEFSFYSNLWN
jgi:hypothetical protein